MQRDFNYLYLDLRYKYDGFWTHSGVTTLANGDVPGLPNERAALATEMAYYYLSYYGSKCTEVIVRLFHSDKDAYTQVHVTR